MAHLDRGPVAASTQATRYFGLLLGRFVMEKSLCFSSVWRITLTTVAGLARLVRQTPLLMRGQSVYD